jgi:hypothetical protein
MKIILMIIKKVLKRGGISHHGDATMSDLNPQTIQLDAD